MSVHARVGPSRKNVFSVMSHGGFGDMTVSSPKGFTIVIPQSCINKRTGQLKKAVKKHMDTFDAAKLINKGITIIKGV